MTAPHERTHEGLAGWWRSLGRGQRAVVATLAAIVLANLLASGLGSIIGGGNPGGPAASSFSTGSNGLEAYADLLERNGHDVRRQREGLDERPLPAGATVVLADPDELDERDGVALAQFVASGGRLVLAGPETEPFLQALTSSGVRWERSDDAGDLAVWVPSQDMGTAATLAGDRGGRWEEPGSLVPLAGADGRAAIVAGPVGDGAVVALADASLLDNEHLAEADNATLGLGLAGERDAPVVFIESVHGFGATGMAALPSAWKWTAAGLVIASAVGMWAAGARFGPAERKERELRPPRLEHVEAIAADLDLVTAPPADLAGALREGALDAQRTRARHRIPDPDRSVTATVAAEPAPAGDRP